MKFKKILAVLMVGAVTAAYSPIVLDGAFSVAYAAKGGAKIRSSAPKASKPAPKSNAAEKKASPNNKDYAPSKKAADLEKNAPAANAKAPANKAANTQQSGSKWGNTLRNIGLFAGGMMLGSLLSNALGLGGLGGMMGDILGLLMNVVLFGAAFMAIRWLWNRFRHKGANVQESGMRNVTPQSPSAPHGDILDIQPPTGDYDAKSTADRYRNR